MMHACYATLFHVCLCYTVYYVMLCCGAALCGIVFYVWYGMV